MFADFQGCIILLPISAGTSRLPAGPGLPNSLAREYWGLLVYSVLTVVPRPGGAGGRTLVLFYAVSVFLRLLAGLVPMVVPVPGR